MHSGNPFIPFICLFLVTALGTVAADELEDISLFSHVINLTEAQAPYFFSDYIIFSYQAKEYTRSVGIAFAHEGYRNIHVYNRLRERKRLFYYAFPPPSGIEKIEYRLIIDGVWGADPFNPDQLTTTKRDVISLVFLPPRTVPPTSPTQTAKATRFELSLNPKDNPLQYSIFTDAIATTDLSGKRVYLVGSFNNWDPYFHRMQHNPMNPHQFFIELPLSPGNYPYYFVVDGTRLLDTQQENRMREKNRGHFVSVRTVP